jgi:hypothetical protein
MTPPVSTLLRPPQDKMSQPGKDLRAATGDVVREMIRRDPVLWERVQRDPELRRQFGFDDSPAPEIR